MLGNSRTDYKFSNKVQNQKYINNNRYASYVKNNPQIRFGGVGADGRNLLQQAREYSRVTNLFPEKSFLAAGKTYIKSINAYLTDIILLDHVSPGKRDNILIHETINAVDETLNFFKSNSRVIKSYPQCVQELKELLVERESQYSKHFEQFFPKDQYARVSSNLNDVIADFSSVKTNNKNDFKSSFSKFFKGRFSKDETKTAEHERRQNSSTDFFDAFTKTSGDNEGGFNFNNIKYSTESGKASHASTAQQSAGETHKQSQANTHTEHTSSKQAESNTQQEQAKASGQSHKQENKSSQSKQSAKAQKSEEPKTSTATKKQPINSIDDLAANMDCSLAEFKLAIEQYKKGKYPTQILGVAPDADENTVKKAYRTLCKKYHPDKMQDPEQKEKYEELFKLVNDANQQIKK